MHGIRVVTAANAFQFFTHRTGGLGAGDDLRSDAPHHRHESQRTKPQQGIAGVAARLVADAVGNEKPRTKADGDLRKTHDSGDRKIFAKLVQGEL